jgi:class 3 adenylate cyclase/CHASE2 domain-containing sensor protein
LARTHGKRPVNVRLALLILTAMAIPLFSHAIKDRVPKIQGLELQAYDRHIMDLPRLRPDPRLILVGMDDGSRDRLFQKGLVDRPAYTRKMHARVLRELHNAGARVVAFDVFFTDEAPREETLAFAAALRECGKAVVALKSEDEPDSRSEAPRYRFTEPVPELRPYTLSGSILFPRTSGNSVRWFDPWPADSETTQRYLHLSVAAVSRYFGDAGREPTEREAFQLGRIHAPFVDEARDIAVRYAGPAYTFVSNPEQPNSKPSAQYVPYEQVYTGEWKKHGDPNIFRDKLVLVGRVSLQEDRVQTPEGEMPGVEVQANAMQTLLQGNWIRHWNEANNYLVKLLLCLGVAVCVWRLNTVWAGLFAFAASSAWLAISSRLFGMGIWADSVDPLLAVWLTFGATSAIEGWTTRDVFKRFVPSQVADDILRAPDADATDREVAIVFCDVRDFTTLSATLAPETAEALLHTYFLEGEATADRFGGVLDKFVGDGMMLYFEPKRGREAHTLRAVRWALAMQAKAAEMDLSGVAGEIGFHIGIGISAGKVRFGRVKARQRLQHTVIGDAVNVASRLQSATKEVHRGIVLSDVAYQQIADRLDAEPLGSVAIKGKAEPQIIYSPIRVLD